MESAVVLLTVAVIYVGVWRMRCQMAAWEAEFQRCLLLRLEVDGSSIESLALPDAAAGAELLDVF